MASDLFGGSVAPQAGSEPRRDSGSEVTGSLAFPTRPGEPLTERYRPRKVSEFIGLERPRKVLSAFLQRPTSSAWLFIGPPGVGKTTLALALAEEINAELHKVPSQKCTVSAVDEVVRQCWYITRTGGLHLVLVDEADQMTPTAQLALLSKLDASDPPPNTVWIFTANDTERLEKRFLQRCRVLEFSTYAMRESLAAFLRTVWERETGSADGAPDFLRIAKDSTNSVRQALNFLEVEILAR